MIFSSALDRPVRLFDRNSEPLSNKELGDLGEELAAKFLKRQGRKVLYRNYRGPRGGELDIVARDKDILSFVEVKTRRSGGRGRPLDAVTKDKRELMRRGGKAWLKLLKNPEITTRYDVVEVTLTQGELPVLSIVENVQTHTDRSSLL